MVSSTTTALGELGTTVFSGGGQKYTSVAQGSAGTVAIAAASTGKKFRVLAAVLANAQSGASPGTAQFKSGTTALTGAMPSANNPFVLPFNPAGWCETSVGEALNLTSANDGLAGVVVYDEIIAG